MPRAELLSQLMETRQSIAVAGAHGKTTTTSMIAVMLEAAGLDPTAVIGGRVAAFGSNARLGRGKYFVAEADESDGSFLRLKPGMAVITNIDQEHLDAYRDFDDLQQAFVTFANSVPESGAVILCADDRYLQALRPSIKRRVVTYGVAPDADISAGDIRLDGFGSVSTVKGLGHAGAVRARPAQRAERAGGGGRGPGAGPRLERHRRRPEKFSGRRASIPAARRRERRVGGRRLRPPSHRNRGGDCRREARSPRRDD